MEITIEEEKDYGKLLGGRIYAGFPIEMDYYIKFGDLLFMHLNACMIIKETLDYAVILNWGLADGWEFQYSGQEFKKAIQECDFDDTSFLGVGYDEDISSERRILTVDTLRICVTEENRKELANFLRDFLEKIKAFSQEMEAYYEKNKELIKGGKREIVKGKK